MKANKMVKLFIKHKKIKDGKVIKHYKVLGISIAKKVSTVKNKKLKIFGITVFKQKNKIPSAFFPWLEQDDGASSPRATFEHDFASLGNNIFTPDLMAKMAAVPEIKVVSFDIFETLLMRPVLNPEDVFYLIAAKTDALYNINFVKMRHDAEAKLNNPYASLDEIYSYIAKTYRLAPEIATALKTEELACEKALLTPRPDMMRVYQAAVAAGKRVIAVSDMYLPEKILSEILRQKGYDKIAAVYVSNQYQKRKDEGTLYEKVLAEEKIAAEEMVHIGDNYTSDYLQALNCGIEAIYYPSVKNIVLQLGSLYEHVWGGGSKDPMARLLIGFTMDYVFGDYRRFGQMKSVFNGEIRNVAEIVIAPLIFYIALSILNNQEIQSRYPEVCFASRDGYLPKMAYDILAKYYDGALPSEYVYAGRRAYFSVLNDDFWKYISEIYVQPDYQLQDVVKCYIYDEALQEKILASLTKEEKKLLFASDREKGIKLLKRFGADIEKYMKEHTKNALAYYRKQLAKSIKNRRGIVFDLGYSGSVSTGLGKLSGVLFDKIYFWETQKNRDLDARNKTKTFLLNSNQMLGYDIMMEELFSPLQGGCIGFDNKQNPLFEAFNPSEAMQRDMKVLYERCRDYIIAAGACFKDYLACFNLKDSNILLRPLVVGMEKSPYAEVSIFKNIVFPDPVCRNDDNTSLSCKESWTLNYASPFAGTGFHVPGKVAGTLPQPATKDVKIGVHLHLYNTYLYNEFVAYFQDWRHKFDLIITVVDENKCRWLKNVFNSQVIPALGRLTVKKVPNRGRDIAPWLVYTKQEQTDYDLFCHIHSKVSQHFNFGANWRHYLLDNLIKADSIDDIVGLFAADAGLGMLFPEEYPALQYFCRKNDIAPWGQEGELHLVDKLSRKMGIRGGYGRYDVFFSAGTMMWYRPAALKPLFDLNLRPQDFPQEPIGVGGTLAHAIERLPAFVCEAAGYRARSYTKYRQTAV